jgi:hypothetical protein
MLAVPGEAPEVAAFLATPPVRHDDPAACRCGFHRHQREIRAWDGPTPDAADLED